MIIQSHEIQLQSSESKVTSHEKNEVLDMWNGDRRVHITAGEGETMSSLSQRLTYDAMNISRENMHRSLALAIPKIDTTGNIFQVMDKTTELSEEDEALPVSLRLTKYLLEKIFGVKLTSEDGSQESNSRYVSSNSQGSNEQAQQAQQVQQAQQGQQGWGIRYSYHEVNYEKESVQFKASGEVTTEDGRKITFETTMNLSKETLKQIDIQFRAGDALIDPLVLNFDGKGVQLSDNKIQFDLDRDGEKESISFVSQGSGFLVLDKNGNGIVDDGSELFGPETNNGFEELRSYDSDENNWIDENDGIFSQLSVWTKDGEGNDVLSSLKESNVGAIYLNNASTSFELGDGKLKETGIFLSETGETNFVQEVDLAT